MAMMRQVASQMIQFAAPSAQAVAEGSHERKLREANLDKTIADSFPASDPPSTIPDPLGDRRSDDHFWLE